MAYEEIENGKQVKGLWAKALAEAEGKSQTTRELYINYRLQQVKDQWIIHDHAVKSGEQDLGGGRGPAPLGSALDQKFSEEENLQQKREKQSSLWSWLFPAIFFMFALMYLVLAAHNNHLF